MKILKTTFIAVLAIFALANTVSAEKYDQGLSFNDAIEESLLAVQASPYKDIYVMTISGSIAGEFVQKNQDVLILKEHTGITNTKTGKEKVSLSFIKLDSIVSISVYVSE